MIPTYEEIMLPLLKFLNNDKEHLQNEAISYLSTYFNLTESEKRELLKSGKQSVFSNRVAWAATYLYKAGLIDRPRKSYLIITERGREVLSQNPETIDNEFLSRYPEFRNFKSLSRKKIRDGEFYEKIEKELTPEEQIKQAIDFINENTKEALLQKILQSSPDFFEKLVIELVVKMGYGGSFEEATQQVGRIGDEGIDGLIKEDLLGFDNIYIQAKRWKEGSIGRPTVQSFVGALHGKAAKKGIFITTAEFTKEAEDYVKELKDIKVILMDKDSLLDNLLRFNLGVRVEIIEAKKIDEDYFTE